MASPQGAATGSIVASEGALSVYVRCSLPSPEHLSSLRNGPSLSVPPGASAPRSSASRSKSGARLRATSGLPLHRQDAPPHPGQHMGRPSCQRLALLLLPCLLTVG